MTLRDWLSALRPAPLTIDRRERLRVVVGAALGLGLVAVFSHGLLAGASLPWLVAPLGASTVLVFGVPASPLAQPWAVVGGNTVSTLVALACLHLMPLPPWWLAGLAVALAIGAMISLRCLHPPGGAAALLVVLAGVHDWSFALTPVAFNSLLLVAAGVAWNSATGRPYPHRQAAARATAMPSPSATAAPPAPGTAPAGARASATAGAMATPTTGARVSPTAGAPPEPALAPAADSSPARFTEADLDAVLARYNQVLDLPRDDLRRLLEEAELQAYRRHMGALRCADIMKAPARTVAFGTPLAEAWALLHDVRIKALPVVDRWGHVVGIVTQADFLRSADLLGPLPVAGAPDPAGLPQRLRRLLAPTPGAHSSKPEVVGQIMSRQVRVVSADRPVGEVVPLFAATGHHHIPVIGADKRIVGILTQTDLVAALVRTPEAGHA